MGDQATVPRGRMSQRIIETARLAGQARRDVYITGALALCARREFGEASLLVEKEHITTAEVNAFRKRFMREEEIPFRNR